MERPERDLAAEGRALLAEWKALHGPHSQGCTCGSDEDFPCKEARLVAAVEEATRHDCEAGDHKGKPWCETHPPRCLTCRRRIDILSKLADPR